MLPLSRRYFNLIDSLQIIGLATAEHPRYLEYLNVFIKKLLQIVVSSYKVIKMRLLVVIFFIFFLTTSLIQYFDLTEKVNI